MNRRTGIRIVALALPFVAGVLVGVQAAKADRAVPPSTFSGGDAAETARVLLELADAQAGGGSWERIGVARVRYLSGDTATAGAVFADLSGNDADPSDLLRIARVHVAAGEWDRARALYERVLAAAPKDADWKVEVGAQLNLHGDRERAESLFREAFERKPSDLWNTLKAAASYVGVPPQTD